MLSSAACGLQTESVTVIHDDAYVTVEQARTSATDLWVVPEDLTRVNGFVIKPEGACLDELCVPFHQDRDSEMWLTEGWFNVAELARKLRQPFLRDSELNVWSFGQIPMVRTSFLQSAMAPDFALPDRNDELVRLRDFRGKKVLILTWASW